jgi:diguanylate cyclase (GGDEF)-like protein
LRILIADDDPISALLLSRALREWGHEVVVANNGIDAWALLQEDGAPRLAILDWRMPGLEGPEVCRLARHNRKTEATYLILLTALRHKEQMVAGMEAGADDYLAKPFDPNELRVRIQTGARIIDLQASLARQVTELEEAVAERRQAEDALRNLTLTDDLTGLYNHRGFFKLTEHCLKLAQRTAQSSLLIYADLDGLKQINDTFGHSEGSQAIVKAAEVLRATFRASDIIGRLGGDEFAVLSQNVSLAEVDYILARLADNLDATNEGAGQAFPLSLSVGAVWIAHDNPRDIRELIAEADHAMYQQKRGRRLPANTGGELPVPPALPVESFPSPDPA